MKSVSNQLNEEKGKVVKFGLDQVNNPTPTGLKIFFRVALWLAALWAIASPVITEIPPATLATINKYELLFVALINGTIQFWGWDYPNSKQSFYNKS